MKCLGTGMDQGIAFKDIEVANEETGKPAIKMHGEGKELFTRLKLGTIHISISHDKNYAIAQAIAESDVPVRRRTVVTRVHAAAVRGAGRRHRVDAGLAGCRCQR